jgi:hypothetical protein
MNRDANIRFFSFLPTFLEFFSMKNFDFGYREVAAHCVEVSTYHISISQRNRNALKIRYPNGQYFP